jgi:hypothetical protein
MFFTRNDFDDDSFSFLFCVSISVSVKSWNNKTTEACVDLVPNVEEKKNAYSYRDKREVLFKTTMVLQVVSTLRDRYENIALPRTSYLCNILSSTLMIRANIVETLRRCRETHREFTFLGNAENVENFHFKLHGTTLENDDGCGNLNM